MKRIYRFILLRLDKDTFFIDYREENKIRANALGYLFLFLFNLSTLISMLFNFYEIAFFMYLMLSLLQLLAFPALIQIFVEIVYNNLEYNEFINDWKLTGGDKNK